MAGPAARTPTDDRRAARALRAGRPAAVAEPLRGGAPDDPQPHRRRGSGPGHVSPRVPWVLRVQGGHQPQGVALPDPHEQLHQHVPQEAAPAADRRGPDDVDEWYLFDKLGGRNVEVSAETEVLDKIPDEAVKGALESLPENFRLPVLLADVEGFSYKEIAEIMDTPIGTVMSRLHRGRKALQKALWDTAKERGLVDGSVSVDPAVWRPSRRSSGSWTASWRLSSDQGRSTYAAAAPAWTERSSAAPEGDDRDECTGARPRRSATVSARSSRSRNEHRVSL